MRFDVLSMVHRALVIALALAGLLVVQVPTSTVAAAASEGFASGPLMITETFGPVGAPQTWTAPSGVTSVLATARGGQGAPGESPVGMEQSAYAVATAGGAGGRGGQVTGRIAVTSGSELTLVVGRQGSVRAGGYNGGGEGGQPAAVSGDRVCGISNSTLYEACRGGGGGGASDVRVVGTGLNDRVLVAGGGGGGGGGFAGYYARQPGGSGHVDGDGPAGTTPGTGGAGATGNYENNYPPIYGRGGGGGGGGYLGGAGADPVAASAAPGGGAGGTDHVDPALSDAAIVPGAATGDGSVSLAYEAPSVLELNLSSAEVSADGTDAITATVALTAGDVAMPGQSIAITVDRGVSVSDVIDHGDGTYTATLTGAGGATSVGPATVTATVGDLVVTRALAVRPGPTAFVVLTTDRGVLAPNDTEGATLTANVVDSAFHPVTGAVVELTSSVGAHATEMTEAGEGTYVAQVDAQPTDTTYTATVAGIDGSVVVGSQLAGGSAAIARTFGSINDKQSWTVPTGVMSATVVARGGEGGPGRFGRSAQGGEAAGTFAVSAGRSLVVMAGGAGTISKDDSDWRRGNGGFNGGGSGCPPFYCFPGAHDVDAGGGGASDLRLSDDLGSRLLVAGGGGGASRHFFDGGSPGGSGPFNTTPGQGDGRNDAYGGADSGGGGGGGYLGGQSTFFGGGGGSNFVLGRGPLASTQTSTREGGNSGGGSVLVSFLQPATMSAISPAGRIRADGTSTVAVSATLVDADDRPLDHAEVSAVADGGATASPVVANGDGTYTTTITAGTQRSNATVTFTTGTLTSTATVRQGPAKVALVLSAPTLTGDGTSTATATATFADGADGGVDAEPVTITATGGHTAVGPVVDRGDGTYTATITSTTSLGTDVITVSNDDLSISAPLEVVHGPLASFTFSDPGRVVAGTPGSVTVTAHDAFGHVATSYAGSPGIDDDLEGAPTGCGTKASDGCAHAVTMSSFVDGTAVLGFTTYRTTQAAYVAVLDGTVRASLAPFAVAPEAAHHLGVVAPGSPLAVGVPGSVVVTVRDRFENQVPTYVGDLALTSSDPGATLAAARRMVASDLGATTVPITLSVPGTQTLTASAPGLLAGSATLAGHLAPTITSADIVTFRAGDDGQSFVVTTTAGFPGTRAIGVTGALPRGLAAVVDQTAGTVTLSGVPKARDAGVWGLTVTASNGAGVAVQHLVVRVTTRPRFLTQDRARATQGKKFAFRAAAVGDPAVSVTAGKLPAWMNLTRLNGGRIRLNGVPPKVGTWSVVLTATSAAGSATQTMKVVVRKKAPRPRGRR